MKNILFFNHTSNVSGAERSLLDILRYIDTKKYKPFLLSFEEGELTNKAREIEGISVCVINMNKEVVTFNRDNGNLFKIFKAISLTFIPLINIAKFIKKNEIDIVYTNSMKAHFLGCFVGKITGRKVVWHVRDILDNKLQLKLFRFFGLGVDSIICISKAVSKQFLQQNNKVKIIYNGIPIPSENQNNCVSNYSYINKNKSDSFRICLIGQIAKWKGQMVFVEAAKILLEKYPNMEFYIIGKAVFEKEEDYERELRSACEGYDNIHCLGHREDINALLKNMHLLVHASIRPEPFGRVIIESMANGTPVIASALGGPLEIIENEVDGILYESNNIGELAKSIEQVYSDKVLYEKLAHNGFEKFMKHYEIKNTVLNIQKLLSELY